jgi:hypothetical protein
VGLGSSVFSAGGALYDFFVKAENAKSYGDLVGSSDKFAELLDIIGTEGLAALIGAKAGQAIKGIGSALEKVGNGIGNFGRSAKARIDNVIGTGARFIEQGSRRIGNEIGGSFDRLRQKLFPQLQPAGGGQIPPAKKNEPLQSSGNGRRNGSKWKWGKDTQPRKLLDYIEDRFAKMTGKDGVRIAGIVNESLEIIERQQGLAMANQVAQRMLQFYEVQYPALQQILADLNKDLPKIGALLPKYQLLSQGTKAQRNSLYAKLDPTDVIAAFRDNIGAPVLKPWRQGQPVQAFDHVDDVAGALKSLRTLRGTLSDLLKDHTYMQTPKIQEIMSPGQIIKYINSIDGQIRSIEKIITPGAYVSRSRSSASDLAHIPQSRSRENSAENSVPSLPESLAEISARNSANIANTLKIALELDRKWQEYDNATNGLARYHQPNEPSPTQEQPEILMASTSLPQATEKGQWQY